MAQQETRRCKVQYRNQAREHDYRRTSALHLSGIWLEKSGFHVGDEVEISVSKRRLVIQPVKALKAWAKKPFTTR